MFSESVCPFKDPLLSFIEGSTFFPAIHFFVQDSCLWFPFACGLHLLSRQLSDSYSNFWDHIWPHCWLSPEAGFDFVVLLTFSSWSVSVLGIIARVSHFIFSMFRGKPLLWSSILWTGRFLVWADYSHFWYLLGYSVSESLSPGNLIHGPLMYSRFSILDPYPLRKSCLLKPFWVTWVTDRPSPSIYYPTDPSRWPQFFGTYVKFIKTV